MTATFEVGDIVHTMSGRTDRIVVEVRPGTPPERYAAELLAYEIGVRRTLPRDHPLIVTRALRAGKPHGTEHFSHPDNLIPRSHRGRTLTMAPTGTTRLYVIAFGYKVDGYQHADLVVDTRDWHASLSTEETTHVVGALLTAARAIPVDGLEVTVAICDHDGRQVGTASWVAATLGAAAEVAGMVVTVEYRHADAT